jgi:hypothetical protein
MTPLTAEQEEQLKERCREIFYNGLLEDIQHANSRTNAAMIDSVRGDHGLLDVLFGWPAPKVDKVMIYPLRTYELIQQYRAKELDHGGNSSSRDQQTEAHA